MPTLHGSWISQPGDRFFFLWGETWRPLVAEFPNTDPDRALPYPFSLEPMELATRLGAQIPGAATWLESSGEQSPSHGLTQTLLLPSHAIGSSKLRPVLGAQLQETSTKSRQLQLQAYQVEGLRLRPLEAIQFLRSLPLNTLSIQQTDLGQDLRFWGHICRWSLDLMARRKFIPGLTAVEDGLGHSGWQPLLDSITDQARLAKFTQQMPLACRAYSLVSAIQSSAPVNHSIPEAQTLILQFLACVIDAQLRDWSEAEATSVKGTRSSAVQAWLSSLSQNSGVFELSGTDRIRLQTALHNWTLPIQEYLVNEHNQQLGQNQFRACFTLQPPTSGEVQWGYTDWKLLFSLQALDDNDFLIAAQTIWEQPVEQLECQDRIIERPQETLLKGLGLASRFYDPIATSLQTPQPLQCTLDPIQAYEFIRAIAWQLQDSGLGVILPPGLVPGAGESRLGIHVQAQVKPLKGQRLGLQSLLSYDLTLALGEQTISPQEFEQLLAQRSPLVEVNGQWLALQPADVRAAQAMLTASEPAISLTVEDALRLSTGDTKTLAKLPVASFEASGALKALLDNFADNRHLEPITTPKGFKGELRPYQARGVSWLAFLEQWGLGACLADDMGLGKTPQLIALLLVLQEQALLTKPTLVICPTSVLSNWDHEVHKFAPTLSTLIHHGEKRDKEKTFARQAKQKALVMTSYALAYRDIDTLKAVAWQGIVLDEAQNIKNPQAKQAKAVRQLNGDFRIALTGTPVENRLLELWSILDFLNPDFLGNQQFFQKRFAIPIEKYGDRDSLQILRSLVRPFILRRLKTDKDIIQDLPDKQEMDVFCGLSTEQAQCYQQLVDNSLTEIEETSGIQRRGKILTLLLRLKQLCNHPELLNGKATKAKTAKLTSNPMAFGQRSGKLLRLVAMIEEVVEEGDHALIFTQFSEWGKYLQSYLEHALGSEVLFLYGSTRREQREAMIERFQNDPNGPRVFILSLKAGGTGLNLTRANHVFHVDRWWNPAVENQATDRAFRIGQTRKVQVHKFICTGTLEERINDLMDSKKQLAEQTVDAGEQWLTELNTDQLRHLLLLDRNAVIDEEGR